MSEQDFSSHLCGGLLQAQAILAMDDVGDHHVILRVQIALQESESRDTFEMEMSGPQAIEVGQMLVRAGQGVSGEVH